MRDYIVEKALHCLSESTTDGVVYVDQDTLPIDAFVDEAGRRVIMIAPLRALGGGSQHFNDAEAGEDGVLRITLPNDFARLVSFKMAGWKRSVNTPIYDTDPQYALQMHPATRGGATKPVVVITNGGSTLEAYSSDKEAGIGEFTYIKNTVVDGNFPEKLKDATAWMTASLYLASMGELDMAKVLESKSIELLQLV